MRFSGEHAGQHLNLAVVAKAPLPHVLAFAEERGWRRLRWNLLDLTPEGRPARWDEQLRYP